MNTPRELTAEEELDLEQWLREDHERWLEEQSWMEHSEIEGAWSINDYENSIAEASFDDE